MKKRSKEFIGIFVLILSALFIFFWLYVIHTKLSDFSGFKREMSYQVFPSGVASMIPYFLPALWWLICVLLLFQQSRLSGMLLNLATLTGFSVYVGLAVTEVYRFTPCSCAGLFHFDWSKQFYFNLIVTAVAAAGLIITYKDRERRKAVWTG